MSGIVAIVVLLPISVYGNLPVLRPLPSLASTDSRAAALIDGIDRICPEQRSSNLLILDYDADVAGDLMALSRWRPLLVQNSKLPGKGQPWFTKCVVGFFRSIDAFKAAKTRFPASSKRILVVPESQFETFMMQAPSSEACLLPIYHYHPQHLNGSWLIHYSSKKNYSIHSLAHFSHDMQGYSIRYLNIDYMRDTTYDRAIGQAIAEQHNGSFKMGSMYDKNQCTDYLYSVTYFGKYNFIVLPEVTEMCFLVPRSSPKSVFWVLLDPYDAFGWIAFGVTVILVSLVLSRFGESLRRYGVVLVSLELLMCVVNGPTHKFAGPFEQRVVGLFLLLGIVLISGYQSLVISFLSAPRYEPELDTLEQINETCFFLYDPFLQNQEYRFKNIYYSIADVSSVEHSWQLKICALLPCSEMQVINVNNDGVASHRMQELEAFGEEALEMVKVQMRYFRYSKARMRPIVGMYQVLFDSPVRPLLERYTRAFVEGCLHHFPTLRSSKRNTGDYTPRPQRLDKMSPGDLLIVWVVYVVGIFVSIISFASEMGVLCARKLKSVQWQQKWNPIKHIRRAREIRSDTMEC